jgi:RNA-directed DNA polymerase
MAQDDAASEIEKLNIRSVNRLADLLKIPGERLHSLSPLYNPFDHTRPRRPFQIRPLSQPRQIDNPCEDLGWVQKRINRRLLAPICFPSHIMGAVRKRGVLDNAERHHGASLLVTLDVTQCFPSITNKHIYSVWHELLGCIPPVASLLTRLTTYKRRLPQGAATSPLLANLFIWKIDAPIREACQRLGVTYSTWIDDLAFSGEHARDLIQIAVATLRANGLRVSRRKICIMGPRDAKVITGTRLGANGIRAPQEKLSRVRSGIHKFEAGTVADEKAERYIKGLVGQLRFIHHLCPKDAARHASDLQRVVHARFLSKSDIEFLSTIEVSRRLENKAS